VSLNVHGKYNLLNILIMKKSILNIGKALNKAEQKEVNGGLMAWNGTCLCPNGEVVNATGTGSSRKACQEACAG
tara:strand:+ start:88 stop:309 length:222 start_codon:yes stop_codon:yes gene_type:complete